jgi:hypothetical protein
MSFFGGIEFFLFLGTALIGFSLENYLPGGGTIAPMFSCFLAAIITYLVIYLFKLSGNSFPGIMDLIWLGIGAAIGCGLGMLIGGFVGFTYLIGPILGGVGAVIAFKNIVFL